MSSEFDLSSVVPDEHLVSVADVLGNTSRGLSKSAIDACLQEAGMSLTDSTTGFEPEAPNKRGRLAAILKLPQNRRTFTGIFKFITLAMGRLHNDNCRTWAVQEFDQRFSIHGVPWRKHVRLGGSYTAPEFITTDTASATPAVPPPVRVEIVGFAPGLFDAFTPERSVPSMPPTPKQPAENDADESGFKPLAWFPFDLQQRIRQAAQTSRKTKRVATIKVDRVTLYKVSDVRRWWPQDFPADWPSQAR
jgi:hypothetical protein